MQGYRLYYLNAGRIQSADEIECEGDAAALRIARERARGLAVEVWDRARVVGKIAATEVLRPSLFCPA